MKLLTILFAFYLLLFPLFPCMESEKCTDEPAAVSHYTSNRDHDQQNGEEDCGPFCGCACCGHLVTSNLQPNVNNQYQQPALLKQALFYHNISLSSDYFGNIWQPPKMS
ncbi:MAG: hypothetical protein IPI66_03235 [Chitinophagaceae bacterium]|nr:hypothetical protein [Chitinophagaceae bacterium]